MLWTCEEVSGLVRTAHVSASSFVGIVVCWGGSRVSVFTCCPRGTARRSELGLGDHRNPGCQGRSISFIMNGIGRVWEWGSLVHLQAVPEEVPLRVYCVFPVQTEVVMQYRCSLPVCINRHKLHFLRRLIKVLIRK